MADTAHIRFAAFAGDFVRAYWQTVKSGDFPMPPNEPIEKTIDELLSAVSYTTETRPSSDGSDALHDLLMTGELGDWWLFNFRDGGQIWKLVGATARSDDDSKPHDLLGPVYAEYFEPFLQHVTEAANAGEHR